MKKYSLIKNSNEIRIIDSFYFDTTLTDTDGIIGTYKGNQLSVKHEDIIITSDNIMDLVQVNDIIGVTKEGQDFGTPNISESYIPIIDVTLLNQWLGQKLNVVSIYKQDSSKNFIRLAEKVRGKWRVK